MTSVVSMRKLFLYVFCLGAIGLSGCPSTDKPAPSESGSTIKSSPAPEAEKPEKKEPELAEPEKAEPEKAEPEKAEPEKAEPEKNGPELAKPEKAETPKEEKKEEVKKEEPEKAEPKKEEPAEEAEAENDDEEEEDKVVLLGEDDLTAGIPGEGKLTVEQIKAWIDDEKNHEVLEVALPIGLEAATVKITGLDKNPLTKAKIELGRQLYFDPRLSADSTISCASCHHPDEGYARHTQFGEGIKGQKGGRNSPVSFNRILSGPQFWDGRADTLEAQAVGPIENPIEMGNTHDVAVETVKGIEGYKIQFDKIFEDGVNIDNIGKAIASFERVIVTGPSAYDFQEEVNRFSRLEPEDIEEAKEDDPEFYARYQFVMEESKKNPMSESAKRGQELFFSERVGCTACHAGANFTDELYHNLGIGMDKEKPDLGRFEVTKEEKDKGAFKTPTVRNIELTAPYMHDGATQTLEEVVEVYDKGGHPNPHLSDKIKKLDLKDQEKKDLVAFMKSLTGKFPKVETGRLPE